MAKSTRAKEVEAPAPKAEPKLAKSGKLALITAGISKVLKSNSWKANTDSDQLTESAPHVPTGSLIIDYLIGGAPNAKGIAPCPGLPRKRITQLWGYEGAGKTTLALTAAAATIRDGGVVVYVDWENAIVLDYAVKLGVPVSDSERFLLAQPSTLEEGMKIIQMAAVGGADLIVIDSVGAAVPKNIAERGVDEAGEQARVGLAALRWSEFLPDLRGRILKSNTAVLGISQVRAKIGGMGNGPKSEPQGGWSWKFYTDLRIEITRIGQEKTKMVNSLTNKTEERVNGSVVKVKIVKCKLSDAQGREENFYLRHGEGIDDIRSIIEIACSHNVIRKQGAWFNYGDHKWQGLEQVRKFFKGNAEELGSLILKIRPFLTRKTDSGPESDVDDSEIPVDALDEFIQMENVVEEV
jgi:recombination protein RecA